MPTVQHIAAALGFSFEGDGALEVAGAAHPKEASAEQLALAMDRKYVPLLEESRAEVAMVPEKTDWQALGLKAVIFAPRARYAMAGVTRFFAKQQPGLSAARHPSAIIEAGAYVPESAHIGAFAVIGADAVLGEDVIIGSHVSIGAGSTIGVGSFIKAGVRLGERVLIGKNAIIHENTVIGADGFSFVTPEKGSVEIAREGGADPFMAEDTVWARIYSLGAVRIGDDVEIGASVTIDRGTIADTCIGQGTKIDNQVQIGHNVQIGKHCLICGQAGIAGSAVLGDRVVLGGQSGIGDHSTLGSDVLVMAASGVSGTVKSQSIVGGTPAVPREEMTRLFLATKRLPRVIEDVAALKKRFS